MVIAERMTLEAWLALPETEPASEYVCGEVIQKPMPNLPHFLLAGLLVRLLVHYVQERRLGVAGPELRCVFGPEGAQRAYVVDVAFVSGARLGARDSRDLVPFRAAPDFAIEVLSPGQDMARFSEKLAFYLRHGVRLIWVVDPYAETVAVLSPTADPFTVRAGDVLDGGDVLPGLTLAVDALFAGLQLDGDEAATA